MSSVKLYVPATIGNVGPGFDVLGLALEGLGNTYELSLCEGSSKVLSVSGIDVDLVPENPAINLTLLSAQAMARALGHEQLGFELRVHQELPVGGGLGSSAAACLAGAYGAQALTPSPSPAGGEGSKTILEVAAQFEGHLDNLAPAYHGGLTVALPQRIMKVAQPRELWIATVTPGVRVATKQARSVLPKELPQADWVRQMALSCALVCAWQQGDIEGIRAALQDPYAEPRRAYLIPGFHELKQSALKAGALGCSISGAGPTVF